MSWLLSFSHIHDFDYQRAWIAFLTIGTRVPECHSILVGHDLRIPDLLVESFDAAVQMIGTVVGRELVLLLIDREAALRDAIAVAPGDGAEERVAGEIAVERIEAEHDVASGAAAIRRFDRGDDAAVGDRANLDAVLVGQRVLLDRATVNRAVGFSFHDWTRWCGVGGRFNSRRSAARRNR